MYAFLIGMWTRRKVTETQIRNYVPRFITEEEAEAILATPQNDAV
ncbi:hypothetical protein ACIQX3_21465 [Peribacillus frigoritolerans]